MQQQQQTGMSQKRRFEASSRKLNKDVPPIKTVTKNTMKMKSKAYSAPRRMSNEPTNVSPKAVSAKTSGMRGAGKSIGKKSYSSPQVTQKAPAQMAPKGVRALSKTVSLQPAKASVRTKRAPALPKSYASVSKSVRKTMGYNS